MVLQPKGSSLKCAIKWISEQRTSEPSESVHQIIEKASIKFNLNPKQTEYLFRNV